MESHLWTKTRSVKFVLQSGHICKSNPWWLLISKYFRQYIWYSRKIRMQLESKENLYPSLILPSFLGDNPSWPRWLDQVGSYLKNSSQPNHYAYLIIGLNWPGMDWGLLSPIFVILPMYNGSCCCHRVKPGVCTTLPSSVVCFEANNHHALKLY